MLRELENYRYLLFFCITYKAIKDIIQVNQLIYI